MKSILFIVIFSFACKKSIAGRIPVGKNEKVHSILEAIRFAKPGDTIVVSPGEYREGNIVISKPVALLGINYPVLDGEGKYENISIKSNNVVIAGFKIIRSGVSSIEDYGGIKMYQCRNVEIRNNILEHTFFGIYAQFCSNCTIENNYLAAFQQQEQQSGNGIHCWKSDKMNIVGNQIQGHRDGIYFEFVTNSVISRNISKGNIRYGLHFMFSNHDRYTGNVFSGNGAGVAVMFSNHVSMYHNLFSDNWGDAAYGLLLKEISDSKISGNRFVQNTTGIHMEGASRIDMDSNAFEKNGWALKIQASCMDIKLTAGNFIGNTFDVGTNGSLVLNSFDGNYWDKYEGYDINRDNTGDIPYRPVSLYSMIVEQNPPSMILFRSFMASLLDKSEKVIPTLTPENLKDNRPRMKKIEL